MFLLQDLVIIMVKQLMPFDYWGFYMWHKTRCYLTFIFLKPVLSQPEISCFELFDRILAAIYWFE